MQHHESYCLADWPAPANIKAFTTTCIGGFSTGAFSGFNMGLYSGDDQKVVQQNRQQLMDDWGLAGKPQWLKQIHGVDVVHSRLNGQEQEADACFSTEAGVASAVLTADCLPVLFCNQKGTVVGAAHAGWKGMVSGVLEATVRAMQVPATEIMAWMGPAIGPDNFEVGPEVREQFLNILPEAEQAFKPGVRDRWFGNLYLLARLRLQKLGITGIYGGDFCTIDQSDKFFSYRRDGKQSGRMASVIWMESTST
ncbi:multi-copper polyphenol oxidoreductase [Endozoicomonas sp. (ex Bugula neritina AB1)]|nr:multi-copper polyphenol oxidoreductase [Endozoicomonas sp. (ex Bugula neritina AB1)]